MKAVNLLKKLNNSMVGYLPIKMLEGIIGIVTLKVYSTLFIPELMGQFTIINTTIIFVFLILLGWINQAVIRFSNAYSKDAKEKERFYSTVFISFFSLAIIVSLVFGALYLILPSMFEDVRGVFLLIVFVFFSYGINQVMMTYLLYSNRRGLNSILLLSAATIKVILTFILTKVFENSILAIFISHSITDMTVSLIAIIVSSTHKYIKLKSYSRKMLKTFVDYGYPLLGLSLMMSILNISDRYLIKHFIDNDAVGLYTTNYTISSSIFAMIMVGLSRGIYPKILNAWNNHDSKQAVSYLSQGGKYYTMIALPAAVGLFLLSKPIASICLDPKYFKGSYVIGVVALGMFFSGLSEYYNKGWELSTNTKPILVNCFIVAVIKIVLNIILIPRFGYSAAAYTTLLTFALYMLISKFRSNKEIKCHIPIRSWVNMILSCGVMAAIVIGIDYFLLINLVVLLPVVFVAAVGYFLTLYLTGEIKNEVKRFL